MRAVSKSLLHNPTTRLLLAFLAWKALLILLAAFCPGPGYDTSALILSADNSLRRLRSQSLSLSSRLSLNLFRWDALYFVKAAQRGYIYEQEWAFSWAYTRILSAATRFLSRNAEPSLQFYIWIAIVISNSCHFISVLVLYQLLKVILGRQQKGQIPFIASILHVLSPAGLFLCAPYTEALFSALNLSGMLCYALAQESRTPAQAWSARQDMYLLTSGGIFGAAALIRGNGLFNGLIFLYDVTCNIPRLATLQLSKEELRRIFVTLVSGALIAVGYFGPQWLAYQEYCVRLSSGAGKRPWCHDKIPSVYSWVQSNYWNVGFLRYWTLPNLPLFLIAVPTLWLLFQSSATVLWDTLQTPVVEAAESKTRSSADSRAVSTKISTLPQLALPQLVLAVLATTNFHVQIANRISSGYAMWYLMIAKWITDRKTQKHGQSQVLSQWVVQWMIMYCMIQAILFANFLPPA
ncbi:mannosyltransferase [Lindgomyces ingoldianus]|uniref:Mannosyltransferase n=1 Tax=Lindgomyces ingoldianus TaxID=673940 RepID=A0ACB6QER2_9PLEO|nr:mannosyltransferase [Lindgomyces ingoldianus]KAF2465406.1 mannosyltransferase [Lindgomyces ingoldianus]